MSDELKLTLPVMIQSKSEIEIFLAAKERLESLGERNGLSVKVGAFLPFMPSFSRTPRSFDEQIENQKNYGLPIWLVETGIQKNNCLSYVDGDPTYDPDVPSDLERVIDQAAILRDLDPNPVGSLVVAPHVGILVADIPEGDFSRPCFYSPKDFVRLREVLFDTAKERFARLREQADRRGLTLALENAYLAVVQDSSYWQTSVKATEEDRFTMHHEVFNDLQSLTEISQGNLVFDAAHFAATTNVSAQFEKNREVVKPDVLFATMGISTWREYKEKVGKQEDYLNKAHAIHASNVEGIGVRIPADTRLAQRWGGGGALPTMISTEDYQDIFRIAQERGLPVGIEQEYDRDHLNYREADDFLEPIFRTMPN